MSAFSLLTYTKPAWAKKIETMFREMLTGPGAIKATVHKYVGGR